MEGTAMGVCPSSQCVSKEASLVGLNFLLSHLQQYLELLTAVVWRIERQSCQ